MRRAQFRIRTIMVATGAIAIVLALATRYRNATLLLCVLAAVLIVIGVLLYLLSLTPLWVKLSVMLATLLAWIIVPRLTSQPRFQVEQAARCEKLAGRGRYLRAITVDDPEAKRFFQCEVDWSDSRAAALRSKAFWFGFW
jgi:hypothetical protein